jgi:hypothetical protein
MIRYIHADLIRTQQRHTDLWLWEYVRKNVWSYGLYLSMIQKHRDFRIGDLIFYRRKIVDAAMRELHESQKQSYKWVP